MVELCNMAWGDGFHPRSATALSPTGSAKTVATTTKIYSCIRNRMTHTLVVFTSVCGQYINPITGSMNTERLHNQFKFLLPILVVTAIIRRVAYDQKIVQWKNLRDNKIKKKVVSATMALHNISAKFHKNQCTLLGEFADRPIYFAAF